MSTWKATSTVAVLPEPSSAVATKSTAVRRPPAPFVQPGDLTGEAGDICEAVLRYQFDNNASLAQRRDAKAFYVTIGGHKRLGAFLDRFKGRPDLLAFAKERGIPVEATAEKPSAVSLSQNCQGPHMSQSCG